MQLLRMPLLTPTTIGSAVSTELVSLSPHRYLIEMAGLTWAFFTNGVATFYRTSEDGVEWSPPVTIASAIRGNDFSAVYDGLHFHYAYYYYHTGYRRHYLYYRMGTPNPDGSITWVAPAQLVKDSGSYRPVILAVDSEGYPWIAYASYVIKSSRNDGGWATEFNTVPVTGVVGSLMSVVPLTGGKMYIMFIWGSTLYGVLWDGSAFGAPENLGICYTNYGYSVVPHGDIVHLVHTRGYSDLIHRIRGLDGEWNEPAVIYPIDAYNHSTITLDPWTSDLHCLWTNDPVLRHVFYKRWSAASGTWDAEPFDLIDESELGNPIWLTSHAYADRRRLGVIYRAGLGAPYEVRCAVMSPPGPQVPPGTPPGEPPGPPPGPPPAPPGPPTLPSLFWQAFLTLGPVAVGVIAITKIDSKVI